MPDIGWMELLVVGIVALIVMGPRDFPMLFRKLGEMTGKIRRMGKEFQRAMDEAADETGMTELNRDLRKATNFSRNPAKAGMDALNETFSDLDPSKFEEGSQTRDLAEEKARYRADIREKADAKRAQMAAQAEALAETQAEADADLSEAADGFAAAPTEAAPPVDLEPTLRPAAAPAPPAAAPEPGPQPAPAAASGTDKP